MYINLEDIASNNQAWWFVFHQNKLLLVDGEFRIPFGSLAELPFPDLNATAVITIGEHQQSPCYLLLAEEHQSDFGIGEFQSLRAILGTSEDLFMMAGRAWQIAHFLQTHQFCGRCGNSMDRIDWELATHCKSCNHRAYPRISPCIIVAIRKDKQILLARSKRHPEGMYSVLAGFVEAGETLEQAVHREVAEEAGIAIKNLKYIDSQPWPFPHSLMMGFTAEHESGDIRIDDDEIIEAAWFDFDQLPKTPPRASIAGRLISLTTEKN